MNMNFKRYRKPDLLFVVACFVALGLVLTSVAQAAQPVTQVELMKQQTRAQPSSAERVDSWRELELAGLFKRWKSHIASAASVDGIHVSQPFGHRGPALKLSASIPERAALSLRAGGDSQVGFGSDRPDAYLFLQKKW